MVVGSVGTCTHTGTQAQALYPPPPRTKRPHTQKPPRTHAHTPHTGAEQEAQEIVSAAAACGTQHVSATAVHQAPAAPLFPPPCAVTAVQGAKAPATSHPTHLQPPMHASTPTLSISQPSPLRAHTYGTGVQQQQQQQQQQLLQTEPVASSASTPTGVQGHPGTVGGPCPEMTPMGYTPLPFAGGWGADLLVHSPAPMKRQDCAGVRTRPQKACSLHQTVWLSDNPMGCLGAGGGCKPRAHCAHSLHEHVCAPLIERRHRQRAPVVCLRQPVLQARSRPGVGTPPAHPRYVH